MKGLFKLKCSILSSILLLKLNKKYFKIVIWYCVNNYSKIGHNEKKRELQHKISVTDLKFCVPLCLTLNFLNRLVHFLFWNCQLPILGISWSEFKLVSQKYRAWSDCIDLWLYTGDKRESLLVLTAQALTVKIVRIQEIDI